MQIIIPIDFFSILKDKLLLLDTNVFIDISINPTQFTKFFTELKSNNITLATIDLVKIEFFKGAPNTERYKSKKELMDQILDVTLPLTENLTMNSFDLIQRYKEEGKAISVTDIFLGATLMSYPSETCLLTKNTNDFPINIYTFVTYMNLLKRKSIQSYGVYEFGK